MPHQTPNDNDGDGIPDNIDPDDDQDGILDSQDPYPNDHDEDDIDDRDDSDDDGDGVPDHDDAFPYDSTRWAAVSPAITVVASSTSHRRGVCLAPGPSGRCPPKARWSLQWSNPMVNSEISRKTSNSQQIKIQSRGFRGGFN